MAHVQDPSSHPSQRKRPSDYAIAFAIAIISSKPDELSVRDYIHLLRQHAAKGRRENALSTAYRHLDRSSYWRAECERVKQNLRAEEAKTVDALREAELLKARLEVVKAAGNAGGGKRKRVDPDVVPYPRSPKKARREVSPVREVAVSRMLEDDGMFEGMGVAGGQELLRALFRINACLKPGVRLEAAPLVHPLITAAKEVQRVAADAVDQQVNAEEPDLDAFKTSLTAAGRVVSTMFVGYLKLSRAEDANGSQDQVTYAFVQMFERLLATIHTVSSAEVATPIGPDTAASSTTPQIATKQKTSRRINIKDNPTLNVLTSFLIAILQQLDPKREASKDLFEGFAHTILSKLGSHVYTLTFNHPRQPTIDGNIASAPDPEATTDTSPEGAKALLIAKAEAPYAIHLLKACLALSPAFFTPTTTAKHGSKAKAAPKPGSVTKASLALSAKERLQHTLVNAMFGTEGLEEDSDLLIDCLKKPVLGGTGVPVPRVKEVDVGEWFRQELWRLLGWEVLGREVE